MRLTQPSLEGIKSIEDKEIKDYWFNRLYKQLLAKAYFFLKNDQYSEDAVHDFYLKLLDWPVRHFQGKTAKELEAYIATALKNHCIDVKRKNKKLVYDPVSLEQELLSHVQTKSFEQQLIEQEGFDDLINLLTPEQREVVVLYYLEEYSHKEIANVLKVKENASKNRMHRALKRLEEIYQNKNF